MKRDQRMPNRFFYWSKGDNSECKWKCNGCLYLTCQEQSHYFSVVHFITGACFLQSAAAMFFMYCLSWIALVIQIFVITLSIAAGLYYLAELVEEYTVMTSRIIKFLILVTTGVYICILLFEEFPLSVIIVGLLNNLCYFLMLKHFPYFETTSVPLIGGIGFMLINHYLSFSHFSEIWYPFSEVLAFFTVCLWLVPFAFFVSLSANENVLPTVSETQHINTDHDSDVVSNYFRKKGKKYGLLTFFKMAQDSVLPQRVKKQF